jgi:hypothetical protein
MILHKDGKMFQDSILATAQHLGIPEVYNEKDNILMELQIKKE